MRRSNILAAIGTVLITTAALADEAAGPGASDSGGHFFLGGGISWSAPLGGAPDLRQSAAVSIDITYEREYWLAGLTVAHAPGLDLSAEHTQGGLWGPSWDLVGLRGAVFPFSWHGLSPYAGAGIGLLFEARAATADDEFPDSPFAHFDSGGAATVEAGVELFRDRRWGRVSVAAQAILPFFSVATVAARSDYRYIPIFLLGIHAQL